MRVSTVFTVSAVIDGEQGEQGRPGDYTEVSYAWSAYESSSSPHDPPEDLTSFAEGEEGWTVEVPVKEDGRPFLWMRTQPMTWQKQGNVYVPVTNGQPTYARVSSEATPVYTLTPSATDIKVHADGSRTPSYLTFRATKAVGQAEPEVLELSQPVSNAPCYFVMYKSDKMASWRAVSRTGGNGVVYNELSTAVNSTIGDYETIAFRLVYRDGMNVVLCETPAVGLTLDGDDGADAVSIFVVGDGKTLELDKDGLCYVTKTFGFTLKKKVGSAAPVTASSGDGFMTVWIENNGVLAHETDDDADAPTTSHSVTKWTALTGLVCRVYNNSQMQQEICPAFSVPVVKTGQDGAMNVRPVVYRITEWESGTTYRNDSDNDDTTIDRYVDIVTVGTEKDVTTGRIKPGAMYIYRNRAERSSVIPAYGDEEYDSHESTEGDYAQDNLTGKPIGGTNVFWIHFSGGDVPLTAPLAYFAQAIVEYLQVGQITLVRRNALGAMEACGALGYGGYDGTEHENLGAPLYLGGASAELANFRVSYEGRLYSIGADITGTVRVTEIVSGEAVERVLISNEAISQGIINEPQTVGNEGVFECSHDYHDTELTFNTKDSGGIPVQGTGMNVIGGTPVMSVVTMNITKPNDDDFDTVGGLTVKTTYKWVCDDGDLTEETTFDAVGVSDINPYTISTLGVLPKIDRQNVRLQISKVVVQGIGAYNATDLYEYEGAVDIKITITQTANHPQKTVIGRNGIYVGAGASSLSGTRVSSWLYADQNRMEMQTGNYGLRCLIGGSATSYIEGVQARSLDSAGTPQWFSLLGTVMTIGSAGSFSINHGTRLVIVSASSGTVTLNLGSGCHDCHEVFIKKTGGCTLNLSGTIIGRNTESVSAIGDNKMHHFICAGTTWYMLEGY